MKIERQSQSPQGGRLCEEIGKLKFFFILGVSLLISCGNEDTQLRTGELVIPVCTGFEFKDNINTSRGHIGIPNNNLMSSDKQFSLAVFPIPTVNEISVEINYPGSKQIWITQAQVGTELNQSLSYLNASVIAVGGGPVISLANTTSQQIQINNLFALPRGYYRLYVKIENELLWENLILY